MAHPPSPSQQYGKTQPLRYRIAPRTGATRFTDSAGEDCLDVAPQNLDLPDGEAWLLRRAIAPALADELFRQLRQEVDWRQEAVVLFGKRHLVPRLVAWHGDPDASYAYSGVAHDPRPWVPPLATLRERVEALTGHRFNGVLLNLYRDGRDGMGWHADDEPELGPDPVIASVSLGATRRFRMRHRSNRGARLAIDLEHGSLLLMCGATQHHWLHALPKTSRPAGERINLTFRRILPRPLAMADAGAGATGGLSSVASRPAAS
jgi:alkylated DNA repair dioxygenase AlkB